MDSKPDRDWRCLKNCYWNGPFQYNVAGPTHYGRWGFPGWLIKTWTELWITISRQKSLQCFQKVAAGHEIKDPLYYKDEWLGIPPDDYPGDAFPNGTVSKAFKNAFPKNYKRIEKYDDFFLGSPHPFKTAPLAEEDWSISWRTLCILSVHDHTQKLLKLSGLKTLLLCRQYAQQTCGDFY